METRLLEYNVRGWLLGINRAYVDNTSSATGNYYTGENFTTPNPLSAGNYFGFELGYDQNPSVAGASWATQQYTGYIAGCIWKLANDGEIRKYDFAYDNANEMLSATFTQYQNVTNGTFNTSAGVNYSVNVGYDYNGNIQNMNLVGLASKTATSSTPINQLNYTYATNSNMLMQVQDGISPISGLGNFNDNNSGVDYGYDANGNMITDLNRQLSGPVIDNSGATASGTGAIQYNILNLPSSITAPKGTIAYFYDAAGNKLEKITTEGSIVTNTVYDGGIIYQNDVLQFIPHEEGRARPNGPAMAFDYFLKDHLGNIRMVLTDDPSMAANPILEATSYYPMGLPMAMLNNRAGGTLHNNFGYQGKEMQDAEFNDGSGLQQIDFDARYYDQQLGIWHNQDPEGQYPSPYMAMGNNWVNGIDLSGKSWLGNIFKAPFEDLKIVAGLFAWNNHQTVGGNLLSILSRFTWQAPQEALGFGAAVVENHLGGVNKVSYFDGATVLNTSWLKKGGSDFYGSHGDAFTLGNFINGASNLKISPNDATFVHEYGRYLQSKAYGLFYLANTAIPNIVDDAFNGANGNDDKYSRDGNARAFVYFNKNYGGIGTTTSPGGFIWDFNLGKYGGDPITGYNYALAFGDPSNQAAINANERSL